VSTGYCSSSHSRVSFHLYLSAVKPPRIAVSCSSMKGPKRIGYVSSFCAAESAKSLPIDIIATKSLGVVQLKLRL